MKSSPGFGLIGILAAVVVVILIGGSAYLWVSKSNLTAPQPFLNFTNQPIPTSASTPTTTPLPAGWTYATSSQCHVKIPVPPKQTPYTGTDNWNGAYWKYVGEQTIAPGMPYIDTTYGGLFTTSATIGFGAWDNPGESGATITISCGDSPTRETLATLAQTFKDNFQANEQQNGSTDTITSTPQESLWGLPVIKLNFPDTADGPPPALYWYLTLTNGKHYLLQYLYTPGAVSASTIDTGQKIWQGITFVK